MTSRPGDVVGLERHDDFGMAAPTPDHFIPLTSYTLGCHDLETPGDGGSPALPSIPADETNM